MVKIHPESQWPNTGAGIFQSLWVPNSDLISCWLLAQMVKDLPTMQETQVRSLGGKIPQRREWLPIRVFLPGESHG